MKSFRIALSFVALCAAAATAGATPPAPTGTPLVASDASLTTGRLSSADALASYTGTREPSLGAAAGVRSQTIADYAAVATLTLAVNGGNVAALRSTPSTGALVSTGKALTGLTAARKAPAAR